MKITPYIKYPKFSKLKKGDEIKFKASGFYADLKIWNGKKVTVDRIYDCFIIVYELPYSIFSTKHFDIIDDYKTIHQ